MTDLLKVESALWNAVRIPAVFASTVMEVWKLPSKPALVLTEVTSNMATTAMLLPVLVTIALAIEVHPYFLLVSATLAASCAFMLPISTPPNAVVFGSGFLKIEDMFKKGIWMNLLSIITITLVVYFTLPYVFEMTAELIPIS